MASELIVSCEIGRHEAGRPLLDLLAERFTYHDRSRWLAIIEAGRLRLNGQPVRADRVLRRGDLLAYQVVDHREPEVPTEIEVVLETSDLVLVGKPAGIPMQRTGQIVANTFVNRLRQRFGQEIQPLHRLDRETSGLLLCARGRDAARLCQRRRDELIIGKDYLAVVKGSFPEQRMTIDQPLATKPDSLIRCRMWPTETGQPCRTTVRKIAANGDRSLLLVRLETGRRHQIRAHLAWLGHTLVGDKIYDQQGRYYLKRLDGPLSYEDFQQLGARCHTLHAWALTIDLPGQARQTCFSSLFSADFQACLRQFPGWKERALACLASNGPL